MAVPRTVTSGLCLKDIKYKLLGITAIKREEIYGPTEWSETDTLQYLRQTRILAQSIIQQLPRMSDLSQKPINLPPIRLIPSTYTKSETSEIHELIQLGKPTKPLNPVILRVTERDYGPKTTEMISHWLYTVLRSENKLEGDVHMFNMILGFFLELNDWHMAMHVMNRMLDHQLSPNRATMHLVLKYHARRVLKNPYPIGLSGHPLIFTERCLKAMEKLGVRADQTTWNFVLQCMPLGFGKSFLIEEMDKRGIELNSDSRKAILQTIIEGRRDSSKQNGTESVENVPHALLEKLDPSDPVVVQLLVDFMLSRISSENANVHRAWAFLSKSELSDSQKRSTEMLNVWLRRFAARRHLDWQFGLLGYFSETAWSSETWQYLLEAASFCKENKAKYVVLGTLLKEMERKKVPLTNRSRYLARRALKKASLHFPLEDLGSVGFDILKEKLQWKSLLSPLNPEYLEIIGFESKSSEALKVRIPSVPVSSFDESRFEGQPRTDMPARKEQLERFLSRT